MLDTETDAAKAGQVLAECKTLAGIRVRSISELGASTQLSFKRARRIVAALEPGQRLLQIREEQPIVKAPQDAEDIRVAFPRGRKHSR